MREEYVNCNLCGKSNYRVIYHKNESTQGTARSESLLPDIFQIVRCVDCSLVYINPRLPKSELIKEVSGSFYAQHFVPTAFNAQENYQRHRNFLRKLNNYKRNGRLLDVGCASGLLLAAAREDSWEAKGVEISELAVNYGRSKLGLDIWWGELEEANYPEEYFDVVTCMDTIEHVPNPLMLLKEVNRILRPGGLIVLSTPNFDGLTRLFLGAKWSTIIPGHLYYFTPKTSKQMLKKNGFEVRKIETMDIDPYAILVSGILRRHKQQSELAEARISLINKVESSKVLTYMKRMVNIVLRLLKIGDKLVVYAEKS